MMKKIFVLTVVAFTHLIQANALQQQRDSIAPHPRIILTDEAQRIIEHKMPNSDHLQVLHQSLFNAADDFLQKPVLTRVQTGRRILSVSRDALTRITHLAYAYRFSEEEKYLQKAIDEMESISRFTDWNPAHFLDVAEMTAALAIGYDWLFHSLTADQKKWIQNAIIQKGLEPSLIHDEWTRAHHNWNQVCNGGMVLGALAVFESQPELALKIINRARTSLQLPLDDYDPDGAYPEGPGYWSYGTSYHAIAIDATHTALGKENAFRYSASFLQSAWYRLHMHGPAGFFNYSDNSFRNSLNPVLGWFAAEANNTEILWNQQQFFAEMTRSPDKFYENRFAPLMMVWASRLDQFVFLKPSETMWFGNGKTPVAAMRTSWRDDALFLAIKGGKPSENHAHMDVGSFVFDALGERWAIDLGGHPYHSLESQGIQIWDKSQDAQRWQIMRYTNIFHNTLVANNSLQKVDSYSPLKDVYQKENRMSATVDITPAYSGYLKQAIRTAVIVDETYVEVVDEIINGNEETELQWNMITHDNVQILNENEARITKNGKSVIVTILSPANTHWQTWSTRPQNTFEDDNPGTTRLGFILAIDKEETAKLQVQFTPEK